MYWFLIIVTRKIWYHTIAFAVPNTKYNNHPHRLIAAVRLKTAGQLWVTSNICPAKYTPRKPTNITKSKIVTNFN